MRTIAVDSTTNMGQRTPFSSLRLSEQEKLALIQAAKNGNEEARNKLWGAHLKLIFSKALDKFHQTPKLGLDDLIQEGYIIFDNVIKLFDPNKRVHFTTYLAGALENGFNACGKKEKIIPLPSYLYVWVKRTKTAEQNLRSEGLPITDENIANEILREFEKTGNNDAIKEFKPKKILRNVRAGVRALNCSDKDTGRTLESNGDNSLYTIPDRVTNETLASFREFLQDNEARNILTLQEREYLDLLLEPMEEGKIHRYDDKDEQMNISKYVGHKIRESMFKKIKEYLQTK